MLKKRSKKPISRMKRSYTVDFAAAQAEDSPVPQQIPQDSSKERLTPTDEEEDLESQNFHEEDVGVPVRRSSNHLVTAIIESSPREQREAGASEAGSCSSEIVPRINSSNIIKRDNINEQVSRYLEEFLLDAPKNPNFFCRMISLPYQKIVTNLETRSNCMIQVLPTPLRFLPSLLEVWEFTRCKAICYECSFKRSH